MPDAVIVVVALTGAVDAAIGSSWDLVVLFAAVAVLGVAGLVRSWSRRPAVRIRGDLVAWMDARSVSSGERVEDVADRAVGAYRAGLVGDPAAIER